MISTTDTPSSLGDARQDVPDVVDSREEEWAGGRSAGRRAVACRCLGEQRGGVAAWHRVAVVGVR